MRALVDRAHSGARVLVVEVDLADGQRAVEGGEEVLQRREQQLAREALYGERAHGGVLRHARQHCDRDFWYDQLVEPELLERRREVCEGVLELPWVPREVVPQAVSVEAPQPERAQRRADFADERECVRGRALDGELTEAPDGRDGVDDARVVGEITPGGYAAEGDAFEVLA